MQLNDWYKLNLYYVHSRELFVRMVWTLQSSQQTDTAIRNTLVSSISMLLAGDILQPVHITISQCVASFFFFFCVTCIIQWARRSPFVVVRVSSSVAMCLLIMPVVWVCMCAMVYQGCPLPFADFDRKIIRKIIRKIKLQKVQKSYKINLLNRHRSRQLYYLLWRFFLIGLTISQSGTLPKDFNTSRSPLTILNYFWCGQHCRT